MNNINKAIAESLGWSPNGELWTYINAQGMACYKDKLPDFEHDLNDAIELMKQMPLIEVFYDGKRWCVAAVVPVYGTDLARAICEAYCQFKGIAIPEE